MLDNSQRSGHSIESRVVDSFFGQSKRLLLAFGFLFLGGISSAQNYLTSTGTPAFAAPEPAEYGFVDASNGNLHLELPIGAYPQRGTNKPQKVLITYDANNLWTVQTTGGPAPFWNPQIEGAWTIQHLYGTMTYAPDGSAVNGQGVPCATDDTYTEPSGTQHPFPQIRRVASVVVTPYLKLTILLLTPRATTSMSTSLKLSILRIRSLLLLQMGQWFGRADI